MNKIEEFLGRISRGEDTIHDDVEISTDVVKNEYESPREPKFYPNESKLPLTGCNIPMPPIKSQASNGDRICNTCNKEDVCMYKGELAQVAKEITQISERTNVFIDVDIKCKKWSGVVSNYR